MDEIKKAKAHLDLNLKDQKGNKKDYKNILAAK